MHKITCCKDCIKRYPGCHASCEEYLDQRIEHDSYAKTVRKAKSKEIDRYEILHAQMRKRRASK